MNTGKDTKVWLENKQGRPLF